jgi:hypothetical protein
MVILVAALLLLTEEIQLKIGLLFRLQSHRGRPAGRLGYSTPVLQRGMPAGQDTSSTSTGVQHEQLQRQQHQQQHQQQQQQQHTAVLVGSDTSSSEGSPTTEQAHRMCHSPLMRGLGYLLAVVLVPAVVVLNTAWDTTAQSARHLCKVDLRSTLVELLVHLPSRLLLWIPLVFLGLAAQWSFILNWGAPQLPWLGSVFYLLPVWRSPTAKLRAFAGAGDATTVRALLKDDQKARGSASRLGTSLRRAIDSLHAAPAGDRACVNVARPLLRMGADPNATNGEGKSALHTMCWWGHEAVSRTLLTAGGDPNLRAHNGRTPLHYASVGVTSPDVVTLLLEDTWATDRNIVSNKGKTAFSAASREGRLLLVPKPDWAAVERVLTGPGGSGKATAARIMALVQGGLNSFQLLDLLWDVKLEPVAQARETRRRLVFDKIITPFVREAPTRKLEPEEKALLLHACKATAGPNLALGKPCSRLGHSSDFRDLLTSTMVAFETELAQEYASLAGAGTDLTKLPLVSFLHDTTPAELSQDSEVVAGPAPWLDSCGDLACAYRSALEPSGAVTCPEELCMLLQGGRNGRFLESHKEHFHNGVHPTLFWLHVCSLHSVARHGKINDEFHAHIKAMFVDQRDTVFKAAALKGFPRIATKAKEYHRELSLPQTPAGAGAAVARVIDIIRCSFEAPSAQAAMKISARLDAATQEQHGVRAMRRKNGFNMDAVTAGGYRDIKYNLLFQSSSVRGPEGRVIVEVQILIGSYLEVKKKMHAIYRIDRGDFG